MSRCHNCNFRAIYVSSTALWCTASKEVTKRVALSVVLRSTLVRMGEMEIDQRLRDLQREYLDFLDDEVLKRFVFFFVKTYRDTSTVTSARKL